MLVSPLSGGPDLAKQGFQGFKLKVGFGKDSDLAALNELREATGPDATLMADANQVWSLAEAIEMSEAMAGFDLAWLEEPLAARENIRSETHFRDARQYLTFVQPDVIKWGGVSMVCQVA